MRTTTTRRTQQGVQSVEIGLKVAKAMAASPTGGMGLGELAKATRMPASKVHRYMVSLCRMGIAEQNPRSGHYDVSWAAIRLGLAAEARIPHLADVGKVLLQLHHQCEVPVAASIWTSRGPAVVRKAEAEYPLIIDTRIGATVSLVSTSIGRVFAAFAPADLVDPLIDAEFLDGKLHNVGNRKVNRSQFDDYLNTVREQGIVHQEGDMLVGLQGLAAPVFDASRRLVMSISMMSLVGQKDLSPTSQAAETLLRVTHELSANGK